VAGRFRGYLERLLSSRCAELSSETASDSELLRRFTLSADKDAFELLVWRHGAMVHGVCQRRVRDAHLAEDAFQASFLILAQKARSIRNGNVAGWLFRVARRVAGRAAQNRREMHELPDLAVMPEANPIERKELLDLLDLEVARLPEKLRRAVLLCYLGGRSTEDAARELRCPRGTILSRLSTARKLLAERMGRKGVTLPATVGVMGFELNGRFVSATTNAALRFGERLSLNDPVSLLAQGVIQTMKTSKQLTFLGMAIVATSLLAGVGWVTAQNKSGNREIDLPVAQTDSNEEPQTKNTEGEQRTRSPGQIIRSKDVTQRKPLGPEVFKQINEFKPFLDSITKLNPTDSILRELQKERCKARASAVDRYEQLLSVGKWNPQEFQLYVQEINALAANLLDVANTPEEKLKCYELRFNLLMAFAQNTDMRVEIGSDPVQNGGIVNGAWIDAEIDLLKFKNQVEKAPGPPVKK
jgi:RNA polymerase sigma factor (sigma-70 family)